MWSVSLLRKIILKEFVTRWQRATLLHHSNAAFYLEDTGVAWQCELSRNFTALRRECTVRVLKNQNIPCRAKGHESATCALLRPHRTQCDEYATRGPAKRLKCVTHGVLYAFFWRANSSEVLLINQKWRFRKNIDFSVFWQSLYILTFHPYFTSLLYILTLHPYFTSLLYILTFYTEKNNCTAINVKWFITQETKLHKLCNLWNNQYHRRGSQHGLLFNQYHHDHRRGSFTSSPPFPSFFPLKRFVSSSKGAIYISFHIISYHIINQIKLNNKKNKLCININCQ